MTWFRGEATGLSDSALMTCDRCREKRSPWELRTFGEKGICGSCYEATLELARGAIKVMPDEPNRLCKNCRAMRDPSLGSAWCSVVELGDERAKICANFVPVGLQVARAEVAGGRTKVIDVWRAASEELRARLGEGNYQTWFGEVEPIELSGVELVLAVPDAYTRDWLEQQLQAVIRNALAVAGYPDLIATYTVEPNPRPAPSAANADAKAAFNPHYTFAEFVVGAGNRLAHASALACVQQPGKVYNPLVLYGGVGVGKTHLLQAIGQEAIDLGHRIVRYVTSETFTNELISAIRAGETSSFRERYRGVDFLLLDDVQFIAGKEATQEEFFHTFNALHQAGKQIVITSDRPPVELRILEDRVRSRFNWGMLADMQPPDLETRIAIARSKAQIRGREVPEAVLNLVATRAHSNVRELEGALNRILAFADLLETEPTVEIARRVMGEERIESARAEDILQAVAAYYRVKTSELAGPKRERNLTYARQIAMYLLREEAKLSLVEIGRQLGRNHSTVIYSCDKVTGSKGKGRVKQDLFAIKQMLQAR